MSLVPHVGPLGKDIEQQPEIRGRGLDKYISVLDHTFYRFTGVITHAGCWENTRKACKSRAEGE